MPPTCFGYTCGHPQGGALQRLYCNIYYNKTYSETFICICWFYHHIESAECMVMVTDIK